MRVGKTPELPTCPGVMGVRGGTDIGIGRVVTEDVLADKDKSPGVPSGEMVIPCIEAVKGVRQASDRCLA